MKHYRNITWHFDDNDILNTKANNKNKIVFRQISNIGKTEFKVHHGRILEFNMFINYINLSPETLYNIILHELGHVYLLGHSEFKDSIMGYKLEVLPNGSIQSSNVTITLSQDDCEGLYSRLVRDLNDNAYVSYLQLMESIYCTTLRDNYISEDIKKNTPSKQDSTISNELPRRNDLTRVRNNNFSPNRNRRNRIGKISQTNKHRFIRG